MMKLVRFKVGKDGAEKCCVFSRKRDHVTLIIYAGDQGWC